MPEKNNRAIDVDFLTAIALLDEKLKWEGHHRLYGGDASINAAYEGFRFTLTQKCQVSIGELKKVQLTGDWEWDRSYTHQTRLCIQSTRDDRIIKELEKDGTIHDWRREAAATAEEKKSIMAYWGEQFRVFRRGSEFIEVVLKEIRNGQKDIPYKINKEMELRAKEVEKKWLKKM